MSCGNSPKGRCAQARSLGLVPALKAPGIVAALKVAGAAVTLAAALLAAPQEARAQNESVVEVHGFVSQGFIKSTKNNYLAQSERGSFELTEVGLNFTRQLTDNLRAGVQIFARDLGPLGNYQPQFDWFYLDYRFFDWLGLRAGRTKLPFGLYNEASDIDAARVPILLPQSVYPVQNRDYLLAQTGLELYGELDLAAGGALEYRAYGGTIFIDTRSNDDAIANFGVPYLIGGRLMWLTPLEGLQLGASIQKMRLDFDYLPPAAALVPAQMAGSLPADFDGRIAVRAPVLLWVASAEYAFRDLTLASEYSRWHVDLDSDLAAVVPSSHVTSERFYAMAAYRLTPWFAPGAYYSLLFNDVKRRDTRSQYQHDVTVSARFDVNPHWLVKAEGHYMRGTGALSSALNDNLPTETLTRDWGVLVLKTTAYF